MESSTPRSMRPRTSASRERTQSFHAAASLKSPPLCPASANSLRVSAASSKRRKRTTGSVAEKTVWRNTERTKHAKAAPFSLTPDLRLDRNSQPARIVARILGPSFTPSQFHITLSFLGARSAIQSAHRCRIRQHSARRDIAPCARDPRKVAADIHPAPMSPPTPFRQRWSHSRESAVLAQPDSPCPARREPSPSRVRIAQQQSEPPPPASTWAPLKTPSREAQAQPPRPQPKCRAVYSSVFLGAARRSIQQAPRTRIQRNENEP